MSALHPGAVIEQTNRWIVRKVEPPFVWVNSYPERHNEIPIPLSIQLLQDLGLVDMPAEWQGQAEGSTAVAIDVETGGFDARTDALCSIGAVEFDLGTGEPKSEFYTEVRPETGFHVRPAAVSVHGLDYNRLQKAPPEKDALLAFWHWAKPRSELVWWQHTTNGFDMRFLDTALQRHTENPWPFKGSVRSTFERLRQVGRKDRNKLDDLAEDLCGIRAGRGAHNSLEDARLLARVVAAMRLKWPEQEAMLA